jgi:hypothetical protein
MTSGDSRRFKLFRCDYVLATATLTITLLTWSIFETFQSFLNFHIYEQDKDFKGIAQALSRFHNSRALPSPANYQIGERAGIVVNSHRSLGSEEEENKPREPSSEENWPSGCFLINSNISKDIRFTYL